MDQHHYDENAEANLLSFANWDMIISSYGIQESMMPFIFRAKNTEHIYLQFQPYPKYIHFILHRSTTWISVSSVSVLSVSGKVSHVLFWKGEKSATEFYLSLILLIEINNKTLSLFLLYFDI